MASSGKRPKADVRRLLIASASSTTNLGVLGAGTLTTVGLVAAGMPIIGVSVLALGALAYGAMIGLDMFNPKFIKKVYGLPDAEEPRLLEAPLSVDISPMDIEPVDLRGAYQSILRKHEDVRRAIGEAGDMMRQSLRDTFERCGALSREAGRVARRGNALRRYLDREHPSRIEAEIEDLERQAQKTRDRQASETFLRAAGAKRQHLQTFQQIEGLYDRIKAQLSVIDTTFDGVHAKVVKLKATDVEEAALVTASISDQLDGLTSDIQLLESTVDETIKEFSL